jgi:hypothetical protein
MPAINTAAAYRFRAAWFRDLAEDAAAGDLRDGYASLADEYEALAAELEANTDSAGSQAKNDGAG